ncbi:heme exporter protein CcmD [Ferrovibrio sp. MS7]|uniref:heme exporter protein CcmD n=1 Tax=Ferrovibrio plantarum TaxID=3119164 RepID=UPI0031348585
MYWSSLSDFFAMGGHAGFIWPAFAIGFAVLGGLALLSRRALGEAERELAEARKEAGRDA